MRCLVTLAITALVVLTAHGTLASSSQQVASDGKSAVVVLNDDNFEHLTQASTGQTTGPWFIKLYAPWCRHCKALAPAWEELAKQLKGEINVAKVDATVENLISLRFKSLSAGYPTLLLFRNRKVYKYTGADRSIESLTDFAHSGYKSTEAYEVPTEPSWFLVMAKRMVTYGNEAIDSYPWFKTLLLDIGSMVMKHPAGLGFLTSAALIAGLCLGYILGMTQNAPKKSGKKKTQ